MRAHTAEQVAASLGSGFSGATVDALAAKGRLTFDLVDGVRIFDIDEALHQLAIGAPQAPRGWRQTPDGTWWSLGPNGRWQLLLPRAPRRIRRPPTR